MPHRNGRGRNGNGRRFMAPQEEIRQFRALFNTPELKAAAISLVTGKTKQQWAETVHGISYDQAQKLVASTAAPELLTSVALGARQIGGKDVLRGVADPSDTNRIAQVAQEANVQPEALQNLARITKSIETAQRTT